MGQICYICHAMMGNRHKTLMTFVMGIINIDSSQRVNAPKPFDVGSKFSIVGAIALTGIVAMMYFEAAVNGEIFREFIRQFLVPKLRPGQYVIFDNVSFHKQKEMIELIRSAGARVVFLPPYSPDLSPIEKMWSKMKEVLKKNKPRTKADFHMALSAALSSMNDGDFEEWYDACGYSLAA